MKKIFSKLLTFLVAVVFIWEQAAWAIAPSERSMPAPELGRIIYLAEKIYDYVTKGGLEQWEVREVAQRIIVEYTATERYAITVLENCRLDYRKGKAVVFLPLLIDGQKVELIFGDVREEDKSGRVIFDEAVGDLNICILKANTQITDRAFPAGRRDAEPSKPDEEFLYLGNGWDMDILEEVNKKAKEIRKLIDLDIRGRTLVLKRRISGGEKLEDVMPEALALFSEACRRTLNIRPYDEQVLGAIAVVKGSAVQMLTGEGKTLAIAMAAFVISLYDKGVHIATFNDYLARRDIQWMGGIFYFLGITAGLVAPGEHSYIYSKDMPANLKGVSRKDAYKADITYGSASMFVFDFEEDNMVLNKRNRAQRDLFFAIVDEGDSILIDEGFTPLSLSRKIGHRYLRSLYYRVAKFADVLVSGRYYFLDGRTKSITLNKEGLYQLKEYKILRKKYKRVPDVVFENCLIQALFAKEFVHRDEDYIVEGGELVIIDEFTGRPKHGYMWDKGLHQAVEAKEGLDITNHTRDFSIMSKYSYFRRYKNLSCCSGTLDGVEEILEGVYNLEVVTVPPHKPILREEYDQKYYETKQEKLNAIVVEVKDIRDKGRPVLVGTRTIKDSEFLSGLLMREGIPHKVLNGKNLKEEAKIIARAGEAKDGKGNVTIVTNLAGRGTDIILGPGVNERGGLHVAGAEHHESKRVDDQLRGRAGRHGDKGSCRFYLSADDYLVRRHMPTEDKTLVITYIFRRAKTAADEALLIRRDFWRIFSDYQDGFFNFRNSILDAESLSKSTLSSLLDTLIPKVSAGIHPGIRDVLDKINSVENATLSQIIDRKDIIRSRKLGNREKILELADIDYERFIFRMQALQDILFRMQDTDRDGLLRIFTEAGAELFRDFFNELESDIREHSAYSELPSELEMPMSQEKKPEETDELKRLKEFFVTYPEIRERLEEIERWKMVIKNGIMEQKMSLQGAAGLLNRRHEDKVILELIEIVKSYEGSYEERRGMYLENFRKGKYRYLFPEEEKALLDELLVKHNYNLYKILFFLTAGGKNWDINRDHLCQRFSWAKLNYRKPKKVKISEPYRRPKKAEILKPEMSDDLIKVKEFLSRHPQIRQTLEQKDDWKVAITHRIMNGDKTRAQIAVMLGLKTGSIYFMEKELINVVESYKDAQIPFDETYEDRKEQYLANFRKAQYGYLFPEEAEKALRDIAEGHGYEIGSVFRYLKEKDKKVNKAIILKRFGKYGIKLVKKIVKKAGPVRKKPPSIARSHYSRKERVENLGKVKEFLTKFPNIREGLRKIRSFKAVIDHRVMKRDKSVKELADLLDLRSFTTIIHFENKLMDIVKSFGAAKRPFDATYTERHEKYISEFFRAEHKYLFPKEEEVVLKKLAKDCDYDAKKMFEYFGYRARWFRMRILLERFARYGIKLKETKAKRRIKLGKRSNIGRALDMDVGYAVVNVVASNYTDKKRKSIKVIDASCLVYWDEKENCLKLKVSGFEEAIEKLKQEAEREGVGLDKNTEFVIVNTDQNVGKAGIEEIRRVLGIKSNDKLVYFEDLTSGGQSGVNLRIDLLAEINRFREDKVNGSNLAIAYVDMHRDIFGNVRDARKVVIGNPDIGREMVSGYGLIWALIMETPSIFDALPENIRKQLIVLGIEEVEDILRVKTVPITEGFEEGKEALSSV